MSYEYRVRCCAFSGNYQEDWLRNYCLLSCWFRQVVHEKLYDEVLEKLKKAYALVMPRMGDPLDGMPLSCSHFRSWLQSRDNLKLDRSGSNVCPMHIKFY